MKRILIFGSGGSGKSTLARNVGQRLNLKVVHLDRLYWKPGWVDPVEAHFKKKVITVVTGKAWVIDGNYTRYFEMRAKRADKIIYLDFPRWLCIFRIIKRTLMNWGRERPDCGEDCPDHLTWEFFKWVWNYNARSRGNILQRLRKMKRNRYIILRTPLEANLFLESMRKEK
jgi:adenylate kinase family enzyme